jgi:hypothetical protein
VGVAHFGFTPESKHRPFMSTLDVADALVGDRRDNGKSMARKTNNLARIPNSNHKT